MVMSLKKMKKIFENIKRKELLFFGSSLLGVLFALLSIWTTDFSVPVKFAESSGVFIVVSGIIKFISL